MMIDAYSFGRMSVDGAPMRDDVKIVRGRAQDGWWRRSGHLARVADLEDVFAARPAALVIGTGSSGLMRVHEEVRARCEAEGVTLYVQPTAEAVRTFNRLHAEGADVAGAFHLTC